MELAERAVALKEGLRDNIELATSLELLGALHTERGEFRKAEPLLERTLAIRQRELGSWSFTVADNFDHLARVLVRLERFGEARRMLERSQTIRAKTGPISPLVAARTFELEGLLNRYEGNYESALQALSKSLDLHRRVNPIHPDLSWALHTQGDVLWLQGNVLGAQTSWAAALELSERLLGTAHPVSALFLRKLALAAEALGHLAEGRRLRERGLRIGEASLAPCHPEQANLLSDLAGSLTYDGEYVGAGKLYDRALRLYERCLGQNHSLTATVIHNQATLAQKMGDFAESERLHRLATDLWSSILGPNHPYVARALDALAEVLDLQGQHDRARLLYEQALEIRAKTIGLVHPDVAWTLTNLARTLEETGDLNLALSYTDRALDIYRKGSGADDPDHFARLLELRGTLQANAGKPLSARENLVEALAVRQRTFGATHPLVAATRARLARVEITLNATKSALDHALFAEQSGREHLQFTVRYLPERQAMVYAAARPHGLGLALSLLSTDQVAQPSVVFDAVIRSRGVVLDELAARAQSVAMAGSTATPLTSQLAVTRQRFANLVHRSLQGDGTVSRSLLESARKEKEELERAIAERSALLRSEIARTRVGVADIRRSLPLGSALVSFVRYNRTDSAQSHTSERLTK